MKYPHTSKDESLVDRELCTVDDSRMELYDAGRPMLLRRLNGLQSKAYVLAPETLSLIFQNACPAPDLVFKTYENRSTTPFVLGQVCFRWRQIAWSTPQLWTAFVASPKNLQSVTEILDIFRTNVAGIPFTLGLNLHNITNGRDRLIERLFREEFGAKIHILHLSYLGDAWTTFFSRHLRLLTKLNDLRIDGANTPTAFSREFSLVDLSSLRKLSIANFGVLIKLPSDMITTLDIHNLSTSICAGLLNQCPNLVTFCASRIHCSCTGTGSHNLIHNQIVLNHLDDFSWKHDDDAPCTDSLLHSIRTRSLRAFSWDAGFLSMGPAFFGTLPNIPNSLTTLSLRHVHAYDNPRIEDVVVKWLPALEHLRFYGCRQLDVENFLQKLSWSDDQRHLPALQTLTIFNFYEPLASHWADAYRTHAHCTVASKDILNVIERRFTEGVCTQFRFVLGTENMFLVEEAIRKKLRKLVAQGFNLEVVDRDGTELVDLSHHDTFEEDVDEEEEEEANEGLPADLYEEWSHFYITPTIKYLVPVRRW